MKKRSSEVSTDGQVLMDHVRELRTRLIVCAVVLVIGGVVGYLFYTPILEWLRSPLQTELYYSTPAGSFNFILKVASMVGILAAVPFLVFQIIKFVQPVFEKRFSTLRIIGYTLTSIILAVAGALFAFYVILPGALRFFAGFEVAGLSAIIDANNYLNFVINAIVTFIIVFQIPLLMIIIDRIKPISPKKLLSMEKYVVLGGLVVSLLVPFAMDITTSILIASPIIILYNLSVGIIMIRHRLSRRQPVTPKVAAEPIVEAETVFEAQFETDSEAESILDAGIADLIEENEPILAEAAVTAPEESVVRKHATLPLHQKPKPGAVNLQQLHEQARLKREQQIAERVARYNSRSLKSISDIR